MWQSFQPNHNNSNKRITQNWYKYISTFIVFLSFMKTDICLNFISSAILCLKYSLWNFIIELYLLILLNIYKIEISEKQLIRYNIILSNDRSKPKN